MVTKIRVICGEFRLGTSINIYYLTTLPFSMMWYDPSSLFYPPDHYSLGNGILTMGGGGGLFTVIVVVSAPGGP